MNIKSQICSSGKCKVFSNGINERYINEDGIKIVFDIRDEKTNKYAILMDGATGLGKNNTIQENKTSAEWYVEFMLDKLETEIHKTPTQNIETIVKKCIREAKVVIDNFQKENNIKLEEYEIPSASLAILKDDGVKTKIFLLGDTVTLVKYRQTGIVEVVKNPNQEALSINDKSVLKRAKEISKERNISVKDTMQDQEIIRALQINRAKKNCECDGGYWTSGTDEKAVEHGVMIDLDNSQIDGVILASDGLDYAILGLDENQVYKIIQDKGFNYLLEEIRKTQEEDKGYDKYPRFKMSDDASGIFLENDIV